MGGIYATARYNWRKFIRSERLRFSIIVPIYKVADYLDDCVQSVKNQTYTDWELILVDDGSPDACPQMCDGYV